jgi:hypothetical protein
MMKVNFLKRTMMMSVIGLACLLGASGLANAQERGRRDKREQPVGQSQRQRQIESPPQSGQPIAQPQRRRSIQTQSQSEQPIAQPHRRRPVEPQRQQQWPQNQGVQRDRGQQQWRLEQQRQQQLALQRQRQEQIRLERLRQEQQRRNYRNRSVYTNPRGNRYRVYRNGGYYQTDQRGADALRQAVNYGYQEGVRAGREDQAYGRRFDYQDSAAYRSGSYGYSYVDSNEYRYYFREGFRRGYEDGYYSRSQYGNYSNGRGSILAAILQQLLNFEAF